jgi:hypothetical protein
MVHGFVADLTLLVPWFMFSGSMSVYVEQPRLYTASLIKAFYIV